MFSAQAPIELVVPIYNNPDFAARTFESDNLRSAEQISTNDYEIVSGYKPDDWIWVELSLVPEVERVFVWLEEDLYRVVTVVDANDEELRDRIYTRELALVEALPMYRFDFYVLPRMGNNLSDLVDYASKPAYHRR